MKIHKNIYLMFLLCSTMISFKDKLHLFTHKQPHSIYNYYSNKSIQRRNQKFPWINFNHTTRSPIIRYT